MSFISFLRTEGLVDARQAQTIEDSAKFDRKDLFIYFIANNPLGFDNPREQSSELLVRWGATIGVDFTEMVDTNRWECNKEIYSRAGGVNESITSLILPLRHSDTQEQIVVMTAPTDEAMIAKLKNWYAADAFKIGFCGQDMWDSLFQMYVQPLLMGQLAEQLAGDGSTDLGIDTKAQDSEARKFYRNLMNIGIEKRASDVHFKPYSTACTVSFRVDGDLTPYMDIQKGILEKISNLLKNDGHAAVRNPREAVDAKVRYSPSDGKEPDDAIDLRVSIIPSKMGPDISVRYLSNKLFTFDELGMAPDIIKTYQRLLELPSGMIIQVGPTGSGKSTTLYSGLAYIYKGLRNIMTAEDPVEILMDGITQIDVDNEESSPMKFSDALKASLRHDPDVIVVGELRDRETAELAVRASNTGHLVLTSLHTNDSIGAFERMINMGVNSYALGEVVAAVMGQRLVKRLCPYCKEPYQLNLRSQKARFYGLPDQDGEITLYKPKGCVHCDNVGYKGRLAINEILVVDSTLRDYIQRHEARKAYEEYLRSISFRTMYQDGLQKVIDGITSLEELKRFASDTIAFKG